jgi:hypothetical protein
MGQQYLFKKNMSCKSLSCSSRNWRSHPNMMRPTSVVSEKHRFSTGMEVYVRFIQMQRLPWHPPWVSLYSKNRIIQSPVHLLLSGRCTSSIWGDAGRCSSGLSQAVKFRRAHSRNVLTRGNFVLPSFFRSKRFSLLQSGLNIQSSGWSDPAYTSATAHAPRVREGVPRREGGRERERARDGV